MCDENKTVCLRLIHISIPSQPDHSVTCQARRAQFLVKAQKKEKGKIELKIHKEDIGFFAWIELLPKHYNILLTNADPDQQFGNRLCWN